MLVNKLDYQKINNDNVEYLQLKDRIKDIKICERAYELMKNHNVREDIILRPLYYLFVKERISLYELEIRLNICGIDDYIWKDGKISDYESIKVYLKDRFKIDEHNNELPGNFVYLGYRSMEYWIKEKVSAYIAWFYKGYSPYSYNKEDKKYHNIAYYLNENNF